MKNKERTYIETIKRFLEPIKKTPLVYIRSFLIFSFRWIDWVIHILFLEKIVFFLENNDKEWFIKILFFYLVFFVVYNFIYFFTKNYWWTEAKAQLIINLHDDYIKKLVKLDNNSIETHWVGKMIAIIRTWIHTWWNLINNLFFSWSDILVSFIFTIYMLLRVNYYFTIIFIFLYIFFHIIWIYINYKILFYRRKRIEYSNLHTKQLVKILMSKFEILQSNKIDKEINILDFDMNKTIFYNKKIWTPMILLFRIPEAWMNLMTIFAFFYFWNQVLNWQIELSLLVWISWSLILMQKTINKSFNFFKDITRDFSEVEVMWDFFDNTKEIEWLENWKDFNHKKWEIKIKNLSYSYKKWKNIFENFSLNIEWEKILALVWNSWWGKSTLAKLISWYIKANSWDIIIDNQNLKDISLMSYYRDIWYLTQEPSVFDWTVLDNLTYSIVDEVNQNELEKIIKLSKCEFIYELIDWLNTQIWERWVKLSGGQKQRLAIAKMFLKNPKIIILDEPTSALDSFSEEQITKAMHNLFAWRTVVIIAHRLQTVKHADRILVIENGEIIEDWNHKSLIKNKWIYKKMLDLQSGF